MLGSVVTVTVRMVTPYFPLCESPHLERMTGTRFIWSIGVNQAMMDIRLRAMMDIYPVLAAVSSWTDVKFTGPEIMDQLAALVISPNKFS